MRKIYGSIVIFAIFFFSGWETVAQNIAINTTGSAAANAAMLDISSSTLGLLIPRVSLTAVGTYAPLTGTAVTSLLVYSSTAPTGGGGAGYYYWDGAKWVMLLFGGSGGAGWLTLGNAGTVDGTNFLGTTDNIPFNIKVNNLKSGRIDVSGNTFLGYRSVSSLSSGTGNTAMGMDALRNLTSGAQNTGIGYASLGGNVTGADNTALGYNALQGNSYSSQNVGLGKDAMYNHTFIGSPASTPWATDNVSIGFQSMYSNNPTTNTNGYQNTVVGSQAAYFNQTGSSNTVMGYRAGYGVTLNSFSNNTIMGFKSGLALTTGGNNILLGYQAGDAITTGSSNIIIGYDIDAPVATGTQQLAIGNMIYGTGLNGTGTTVSSTGKIGIGLNNPSWIFHVTGSQTGVGGLNFPIAYVENTNNTGVAIQGSNTSADAATAGFGIQGSTNQQLGQGIYGVNSSAGTLSAASLYYAIKGVASVVSATAFSVGSVGWANSYAGIGTMGKNFHASGTGVLGTGNALSPNVYVAGGAGGQFYGLNRAVIARTKNTSGANLSGNAYIWDWTPTSRVDLPDSYTYDVIYGGNDYITSNTYNFGVHGQVYIGGTGVRNGGVIGTLWGTGWTSLGYRALSTTNYACYGTAAMTTGTGRLMESPSETGIGFGFYGGSLGGWVRGNIYGMNIKGDRYSMYIDGKTYTNGIISQLNSDSGAELRTVTYVPSSTSVDIYTKGSATMTSGRAFVKFDANYSHVLSSEIPIIVTVTPMGKSNGVYIESVSTEGFMVVENNDGTSNVQLSWIAVGTKKGYENPVHPKELLSGDYDKNMNDVMFNENEKENVSKPMWWDGKQIRFDAPPQKTREPLKEPEPGSLTPNDGPLPPGWSKPR